MTSTSLFPPSAEPPGGRAVVLPASLFTSVLVAIGRRRRLRRWGTAGSDARFAYADPPSRLDLRGIANAMPARDPSEDLAGSPELDMDLPPEIRRATLWAALIGEELHKAASDRMVKGVRELACGFVRDAGGSLRLAAICYVRRTALTQAAPLHLKVEQETFPLVLRPLPRDIPTHRPVGFPRGLVTASARLGEVVGTLTAAHVVAADGTSQGIAEGQQVPCADCAAPDAHRVLRASAIMDAVFIESGPSSGAEAVLHSTPVAGYFPVEMQDPEGNSVTGWVTEITMPQGVIPGSPQSAPSAPATLTLTFPGDHGWSGGLVRETLYRDLYGGHADPAPYGMFLGVRQLRTTLAGRMNMLAQLEQVWKIELVRE